jgi:hypothetical protein
MLLFAVTNTRPSPNAGRWYLLMPGVAGRVIGCRMPLVSGTALKALRPVLTSVIHRIPLPARPPLVVTVGCPTPARPADVVGVLPASEKKGFPEESVPNL